MKPRYLALPAVFMALIQSCGLFAVPASYADPESVSATSAAGIRVIISGVARLAVGGIVALAAEVQNDPSGAGVAWSSSDEAVATVSTEGVVSGLSEGRVYVYATSIADPRKSASVSFLVSGAGGDDASGSSGSGDQIAVPAGYSLVWHDEFAGTAVDESNWSFMLGDGSGYGIPGWGNSELEYYRRENADVASGALVITARKESFGGRQYTSARLRTAGKVHFTYGRIQARIELPAGAGLWPAFWMLPEQGDWPRTGEIDIMENSGGNTGLSSGALHYADAGGNHQYQTDEFAFARLAGSQDTTSYHLYELDWEADGLKWYVDGNLFLALDNWTAPAAQGPFPAPFDRDFHILLNMAVGGNYVGYQTPEDSVLPAAMKVDYVRWFQKERA